MSLSTELTTDPMNLGYNQWVISGNIVALYNLIHDTSKFTMLGWVSVSQFNTWCASNNAEYQNIKTLAANSSSPYNAAADAILRCLNGAVNTGALNLADTNAMNLLNTWPFVDTTGATKTTLINFGTYPASRAMILGIDASIQDISAAIGHP